MGSPDQSPCPVLSSRGPGVLIGAGVSLRFRFGRIRANQGQQTATGSVSQGELVSPPNRSLGPVHFNVPNRSIF